MVKNEKEGKCWKQCNMITVLCWPEVNGISPAIVVEQGRCRQCWGSLMRFLLFFNKLICIPWHQGICQKHHYNIRIMPRGKHQREKHWDHWCSLCWKSQDNPWPSKAEKHQQQVLKAQFDAIKCTKYILQRLFDLRVIRIFWWPCSLLMCCPGHAWWNLALAKGSLFVGGINQKCLLQQWITSTLHTRTQIPWSAFLLSN